MVEFEKIGTLESWNSDGLRTLIETMKHVPNMIEKTLTLSGLCRIFKSFKREWFFSYDEIDVNGQKVRPIDLTSKLLFPKWEMKDGDKDFTVMRIRIIGEENKIPVCYEYNLLDRYTDGVNSMSRTTGYTCTGINLVVNGDYKRIGISPPEYLGNILIL